MEKVFYYPGTPPPVGKAFRNDYAFAEIVSRVYVMDWQQVSLPFSAGNQRFLEERGVAFAEPGFFDILDFPLIKGDRKNILSAPNTALITERLAKKYFGTAEPLGKIIRVNNNQDFRITGILADLPANTDRRQEIYLPFSSLKDYNRWAAGDHGWGGVASDFQCFVLLKPGVSPAAVNAVFPGFLVANTMKATISWSGSSNCSRCLISISILHLMAGCPGKIYGLYPLSVLS